MYRQSEKKLVRQQYLLHTSPQYGTAYLGLRSVPEFGAPQQISTGFACWFRYCSDVADRRQTKFARCLAVCWAATLYIHFQGLLPSNGNLPCARFTLCPRLAFCYIGTVSAWHCSMDVSQTLWRGTQNGIGEFLQRAAPVFGWAPVTLGIGSHSS